MKKKFDLGHLLTKLIMYELGNNFPLLNYYLNLNWGW